MNRTMFFDFRMPTFYKIEGRDDNEWATKKSIKDSEEHRKNAPNKSDIEETIEILEGFGYKLRNKSLPKFKSNIELYAWRKRLISEKLNGVA